MKRRSMLVLAVLPIVAGLPACARRRAADDGWIALFDGTGLERFRRVGNANWRVEDRVLVANGGEGYLVTGSAYRDFHLHVEFWVDEAANSGIFLRVADPRNITPATAYEVNIFDARPDPAYGTGAIVGFAPVSPMPRAAGRWNTYDITARGPQLVVALNGKTTVDIRDAHFQAGPIALQYAGGVVKFRRVRVRPL